MTCEIGQTYTVLYPEGSVVYWKKKAEAGTLYKVAVKKFFINNQEVVYKDTTNRLWLEEELCPQSEAVALAEAYYNHVLEELEELE
jgi:hypothetical protein